MVRATLEERTAVVSCRVAGQNVSDVGLRLDDEFRDTLPGWFALCTFSP